MKIKIKYKDVIKSKYDIIFFCFNKEYQYAILNNEYLISIKDETLLVYKLDENVKGIPFN